ncbi:EAL domain-containing protein [Sulfurimonas sp.]|uniref:EAL domain-containing protein n=1 Tax=Sulfurimonas sp. TaxID=2022749 RepID=UPI0039E2BC53
MIRNFIFDYFVNQKVSFRLLVFTLLFSALITLFITIVQLYMDYKNGIKSIHTQLELVESSYTASVSQSIWVFDEEQINLQLEGIVSLPDILFTSLTLGDSGYYEYGKITDEYQVEKKFKLIYKYNLKEVYLGELKVVADLDKLYEQLEEKIFVILLSQGVKTFFVSLFILFLFQILVTRHLESIASYAKSLRINQENKPLVLNKIVSTTKHDELDLLVNSINVMQRELHSSFKNVTRQLEKRKKLEKTLVEYKKAMDASAYVSRGNLEGNITYVNELLCQVSGYTAEELIGKSHNIFRHPDSSDEFFADMWKTLLNKEVWSGATRNIKKDATSFDCFQTIIPILDVDGNIREYIASRYDITELVEKRESLEKAYQTDSLTGLENRIKLLKDIKEVQEPALAIIDIDSFKEINDFYGHEIGDYVILEVAKRLKKLSESRYSKIYRLQADQFALFCTDYQSKERFEKDITTLISELVDSPIYKDPYELLIGITAGISFGSSNLFINADIGLKVAKKENKNYLVYNSNFNIEKEYESNLHWTKKLKKALHEKKIVAYYQPIYNNKTAKIEKFEALVRMIDEDGSIISPYFFLDIARKVKLYPQITMIMIDSGIRAAKNHDYEFSINLTIDDISNEDVSKYFLTKVKESGVGHKIVMELVESEGIEDFQNVKKFIDKIKGLGCKLAIDDFGTGYSNFEYLLRLNADYIKIDGSLIKDIDKNKNVGLVAETIVAFSKISNMKTIAEFVSHKEILDIVQGIDVDYLQGYYISEPIAYEDISKFKEFRIT